MEERRQCASRGCLIEPDLGMHHCWRHIIGEITGTMPASNPAAPSGENAMRWAEPGLRPPPPKPGRARPIWEKFALTKEQMMEQGTAHKPFPSQAHNVRGEPKTLSDEEIAERMKPKSKMSEEARRRVGEATRARAAAAREAKARVQEKVNPDVSEEATTPTKEEALKLCVARDARRPRLPQERSDFQEAMKETLQEPGVFENPPGVSLRHELEAQAANEVHQELEEKVTEVEFGATTVPELEISVETHPYLAGMRPALEQVVQAMQEFAEHEAQGEDGFDTQLSFPGTSEEAPKTSEPQPEEEKETMPKETPALAKAREALAQARAKKSPSPAKLAALQKARDARSAKAAAQRKAAKKAQELTPAEQIVSFVEKILQENEDLPDVGVEFSKNGKVLYIRVKLP